MEGGDLETALLPPAASSLLAAPEPAPADRLGVGYLVFFTLGAGFLLPWNAFITAVDYFSYLYPGAPVERVFSVSYMVSRLLTVAFLRGSSSARADQRWPRALHARAAPRAAAGRRVRPGSARAVRRVRRHRGRHSAVRRRGRAGAGRGRRVRRGAARAVHAGCRRRNRRVRHVTL
jgi:hypothetical protein